MAIQSAANLPRTLLMILHHAEAIWATCYMYANLALSAYILGSITLLVVKSDEAAGQFRDSANAMKQYIKQHSIPAVSHTLH